MVPGSGGLDPAYGLKPPTLDDARAVVASVYPEDVDRLWAQLLASAGLSGGETGGDAVPRIAAAMAATDRVLELCAVSLTIRRRSHEELSAAATIIQGVR